MKRQFVGLRKVWGDISILGLKGQDEGADGVLVTGEFIITPYRR